MTSTLHWHPASEPPNNDRRVILACKGDGYSTFYTGNYETDFAEHARWWNDMAKGPLPYVRAWADFPEFPEL